MLKVLTLSVALLFALGAATAPGAFAQTKKEPAAKTETKADAKKTEKADARKGKLDLNTATAEEL